MRSSKSLIDVYLSGVGRVGHQAFHAGICNFLSATGAERCSVSGLEYSMPTGEHTGCQLPSSCMPSFFP